MEIYKVGKGIIVDLHCEKVEITGHREDNVLVKYQTIAGQKIGYIGKQAFSEDDIKKIDRNFEFIKKAYESVKSSTSP